MRFTRILCFGFSLVAWALAGTAAQCSAQTQQAVVAGPAVPVTFKLEGIWAGVGYLDEEKLAAKLESMKESPEREELINKAATFLTIVAAMELKPDGSLETDLEVTDAEGKTMREPTIGKWKVIERKDNRILIELEEKLLDETGRTSRRLIQFYDDGEHIAVLIESDPQLSDYNPLVVMERVPLNNLAQAEGTGSDIGTIRK